MLKVLKSRKVYEYVNNINIGVWRKNIYKANTQHSDGRKYT